VREGDRVEPLQLVRAVAEQVAEPLVRLHELPLRVEEDAGQRAVLEHAAKQGLARQERVLGLALRGHVGVHAQDRAATAELDHRCVDRHRHDPAVCPAVAGLELDRAGREGLLDPAGAAVFFRSQLGERQTEKALPGVAVERAGAVVHIEHGLGLGIDHDHRALGALEHLAVGGLALAQRRLGLAALGEVLDGALVVERAAIEAPHRSGAFADRDRSPVLAQPGRLIAADLPVSLDPGDELGARTVRVRVPLGDVAVLELFE
jgi:hypothetical protein